MQLSSGEQEDTLPAAPNGLSGLPEDLDPAAGHPLRSPAFDAALRPFQDASVGCSNGKAGQIVQSELPSATPLSGATCLLLIVVNGFRAQATQCGRDHRIANGKRVS